jgi:hypothetical protein
MDFSIPKKMYGFAFVKNLSSKVLYKLKNVDCCYLLAGKASIDKYMEFLLHDQPENIIGMGVYFREDYGKIRIENLCTNKLKNKLHSSEKLVEYRMSPFIHNVNGFKVPENKEDSYKIGDSYCNYVSFKIMNLIGKGRLNCGYTFLHIPKKLKFSEVAPIVDVELEQYLKSTKI